MNSELIFKIESEFANSECLQNMFIENVPKDDFYQSINDIFYGKKSSELRTDDWLNLGFPPVLTRRYLNIESYLFVIKPILIESVQNCIFYLALELILPDNHKKFPRGWWWKLFKENLNDRQREVLQDFLNYVLAVSPEDSEERINAETALSIGVFI